MIWYKKNFDLDGLNDLMTNTMGGYLDLKFTEIGENYLRMSMPVSEKTRQPYGYIHGGANCVLIETIGSLASALMIDTDKYRCVGIEINANHLRSVTKGSVIATVRPLHIGRTTHVWDVKIETEEKKLSCVGRLTVAIVPAPKSGE